MSLKPAKSLYSQQVLSPKKKAPRNTKHNFNNPRQDPAQQFHYRTTQGEDIEDLPIQVTDIDELDVGSIKVETKQPEIKLNSTANFASIDENDITKMQIQELASKYVTLVCNNSRE